MNLYYYIKKIDNYHNICLKTNNIIEFKCRKNFDYNENYNNIEFNINCNTHKENLLYSDKFKVLLENKPFDYINNIDQFKIFEIYKYEINNINYINNLDDPTLCLSLFIRKQDLDNIKKNSINNPNLFKFFVKYVYTQIKLILSYRFYFPLSNIILYIDINLIEFFETPDNEINSFLSYLLNKIFKSRLFYLLNNEDENFNKYIQSILTRLRKYEYYNFDNFFNRYIFYIYFICSSDYNNFDKSDNYAIIYGYKFNILNNIEKTEYIGQLIRYLPLTINKNRHKHFIWRDPSHIIIKPMEAEWIKSFNQICKNNKDNVYLLPITSQYCRPWHDVIKSDIDNKYYQYSVIAGTTIQMCNFTDTDYFFDIDTYVQSIGLPFLLDKDNDLILFKNCPHLYNYGIDEYVLSSFLIIDSIKSKSIYAKQLRISDILNMTLEYYNEISISIMLLFVYLYEHNGLLTFTNDLIDNSQINQRTTLKNFINSIEILRKLLFNINNKYFDKIILLLSIVPTIYNIHEIVSENYVDELRFNMYNRSFNIEETLDNILNIFRELYNIKIDRSKLYKLYSSKKILSKLNINWATSLINTSTEWNTYPYYKDIKSKNYNFYAGLYLSGVYNHRSPDNICIIKTPSDLNQAYNVLKKRGSIELTDYKLQNDELTSKIISKLNKDHFKNINKGLIKKDIISKILDIDREEIKKSIYSSIIWRILLFNHYNIPVEFIRFKKKFKKDSEISSYNISKLVKKYLNRKNNIIKILFNNQQLEKII